MSTETLGILQCRVDLAEALTVGYEQQRQRLLRLALLAEYQAEEVHRCDEVRERHGGRVGATP